MARRQWRRASRARATGFTYLEILVALIIVSFGLIAVLSAYTYSVNTSEYCQRAVIATHAANSKMGEMRAMGFSWLTYLINLGSTSFDFSAELPPELTPGTMTVTLSQWTPEIVQVDVDVTWRPDAKITGGNISLSTLVGQVEEH